MSEVGGADEGRLMPTVQYPGQCALVRLRPGVLRG
jgi:hypothetical protein